MIKELLEEMFILKERGYYKQAIEILYKLLEMVESQDETVEILYELAEIHFFSGNLERSMYYVDKLLDMNEEHPEALKLQIKLFSKNPQRRMLIAQKLYKITNKLDDLKLYLALLNKAPKTSSLDAAIQEATVVEEATKLGCVDYVDYLSVIPSLYEERVINGETNTISSTINDNFHC